MALSKATKPCPFCNKCKKITFNVDPWLSLKLRACRAKANTPPKAKRKGKHKCNNGAKQASILKFFKVSSKRCASGASIDNFGRARVVFSFLSFLGAAGKDKDNVAGLDHRAVPFRSHPLVPLSCLGPYYCVSHLCLIRPKRPPPSPQSPPTPSRDPRTKR